MTFFYVTPKSWCWAPKNWCHVFYLKILSHLKWWKFFKKSSEKNWACCQDINLPNSPCIFEILWSSSDSIDSKKKVLKNDTNSLVPAPVSWCQCIFVLTRIELPNLLSTDFKHSNLFAVPISDSHCWAPPGLDLFPPRLDQNFEKFFFISASV